MERAINQVEELYVKMSGRFAEGTLEPWQPATFEGHSALEANTRYFTPAHYAVPEDRVEFAPYVDNNGILKSLMEGEFVHTTDNRVDYLERITATDGTKA
jgi:hypothetical protein